MCCLPSTRMRGRGGRGTGRERGREREEEGGGGAGGSTLCITTLTAVMATATLREAGITHIVNVTPNEKDFFPLSFTYLRVPVNDTASGRLDRHWEAAFTFIASAVANGGRVLVHCSAGVSRSASLVIYCMMRKYRMTLMAAYRALKTSRGCIAPNFTFWQQLVGELVFAPQAVVHLDHLCRGRTPTGSAWSACVSWGTASVTRRALQMQRSSWQAW